MIEDQAKALKEALLFIDSGLFDQASRLLDQIEGAYGPSIPTLMARAKTCQKQGDTAGLVAVLWRILDLDANHKPALFGLAGALSADGLAPEPEQRLLDGLVTLARSDPAAIVALATVLDRQSKRERLAAMVAALPGDVLRQDTYQQAVIAVTQQWYMAGHKFVAWEFIEQLARQHQAGGKLLAAAGLMATSLDKSKQAIEFIDQALQAPGADQDALCFALGKSLYNTGDYSRAMAVLDALLDRNPSHDSALMLLGLVAIELDDKQRLERALAVFANRPLKTPQDWFWRGYQLRIQGETQASIEHLQQAVEQDETLAHAWAELAEIYASIHEIDKAQAAAEMAIKHAPNMVGALIRLGNCLRERLQQNEAMAYFKRAVDVDPSNAASQRVYLFSGNYADQLPPAILAKAHRDYGDHLAARAGPPPVFAKRSADKKLRVAFVSGDFRRHSVGYFLLPLYRGLKQQFADDAGCELISVSCYNGKIDAFTEAFKQASDEWHEVDTLNDMALVDKMRGLEVDLAIDLAGYTTDEKQRAFAERMAPVQLTYLGYPNTSGIATIDGRITDHVADPPGMTEHLHREPLLRLEHCFLSYDPTPTGDDLPPADAIDHPKVRFGCFNNLSKVTRHQAEIWAQILKAVPNSKLIFKTGSVNVPAVRQQLAEIFSDAGVDAQKRLEMRSQTRGYLEHMAMYREIDISLDTFHYTGTTTTCEALVMGTPVLTKTAQHHAARVSASILHQIGRDDLVVDNDRDYIDRAVALAADVSRIRRERATLRQNFQSSRIMDHNQHGRDFMAIMREAWRAYCK